MRGKPGHNYATFNEVEIALTEQFEDFETFVALNPAHNFEGDTTRDTTDYMQKDMEMVLRADVIVLLPDWRTSEGALREVQLGIWTGKRFMLATHWPRADGSHWGFVEIATPTLETEPSPRASALDEAKQLITGDRNNSYGP